MNLPDIVFSKWAQWNDRTNLDKVDRPGVYALAHFKTCPIGNADLLAQEIIYFGITCDQSLWQRWNQFHHSAFEGQRGHGGGMTYWNLFQGKRGPSLFVAAFPVDGLYKLICDLFIRCIERKLILEYALKWNARPKCTKE